MTEPQRHQELEPDMGKHVLDQSNSHKKYVQPKTANLLIGLQLVEEKRGEINCSPRGGSTHGVVKAKRKQMGMASSSSQEEIVIGEPQYPRGNQPIQKIGGDPIVVQMGEPSQKSQSAMGSEFQGMKGVASQSKLSEQVDLASESGIGKDKKKKYKLQDGDEVLDYRYDENQKRKKRIRRIKKQKKTLTAEEVKEIKEAFDLFDKDGSQSIDVGELKDAMKALGIHLDKKQVKLLMEKADKDGSGSIDLDEFTSLMAEKIHARDTRDELKKAFWMYDDDEGGTIGFENLKRASEDLNVPLDDDEIYEMLRFADTKNLGEVDLDDFFKVMQDAKLF